MNNPIIIAISLTTFFNALPRSSPPRNPPPTAADAETKLSAAKSFQPYRRILSSYLLYGISLAINVMVYQRVYLLSLYFLLTIS